MRKLKILPIGPVIALAALLCPTPALAASVNVEWAAPTSNEDGSDLTDLAGFIVYHGKSKKRMKKSIDVGVVTSHTLSGLRKRRRRYFIAISAYDESGNESEMSNKLRVRRKHLQKKKNRRALPLRID